MVLFFLILIGRFCVDMANAKSDKRIVLLEELGKIEVLATIIGLLVEVHGPNANLSLLKIGGYIHDEIIGTHISEESHKTTFIKLDELLGYPDGFQLIAFKPMLDEHVSRKPDDMLFDQCILVCEKVHSIRRKQMLEFQSVKSGSIGLLDVEVVVVVVVLVGVVADRGHEEMLELLLANGVNLDALVGEGLTLLDVALGREMVEMANLLAAKDAKKSCGRCGKPYECSRLRKLWRLPLWMLKLIRIHPGEEAERLYCRLCSRSQNIGVLFLASIFAIPAIAIIIAIIFGD